DQGAVEVVDHGVEAAGEEIVGVGMHQYSLPHLAGRPAPWHRTAMRSPVAVVVLAAGASTRMKSALPKVLHPLAGKPMLRHVLDTVARLRPASVVGVVAPGAQDVAKAFAPHRTVVQRKPLGTGDAVKAALPALAGHAGA